MSEENTAQRLQETAAKCLSSLDAWNSDLKDTEARETLLEAVHELRKVTSRLEIDIAMNDRKAVNAKPIPIPEHKSKMERKNQKPLSEILPVAELKEAGEKRKIAIAEAKAAKDQNADVDEDTASDNVTENTSEEKKPARRPRRKKKEDGAE
jgi:AAA15 family ATPase/GTPase